VPDSTVWVLDDGGMKQVALRLQDKFPEKIGHIDLEKVMFVRLVGGKVSWAGKCFHVRPPWHLLTQATAMFGAQMPEPLDIRYIIAVNDDLVRGIFIVKEKEVMVILHELLHVRRDMEGVVPHDTEDFSWMLSQFGINWLETAPEEVIRQFSSVIEEPPEGQS